MGDNQHNRKSNAQSRQWPGSGTPAMEPIEVIAKQYYKYETDAYEGDKNGAKNIKQRPPLPLGQSVKEGEHDKHHASREEGVQELLKPQ